MTNYKCTLILALTCLFLSKAQAQKEGFSWLTTSYLGNHQFVNIQETDASTPDEPVFENLNFSSFNLELQGYLYDGKSIAEIHSDVLLFFPFALTNWLAGTSISDGLFFQYKDPWGDITYIGFNFSYGETLMFGGNLEMAGYGSSQSNGAGTGLTLLAGINSRYRMEDLVGELTLLPGIEWNWFAAAEGKEFSRGGIEINPFVRAWWGERIFVDLDIRHKRFKENDEFPKGNATSILIGGGFAF